MKHVVKYDVYLDILLMVYIYVITYSFLRERHPNQKILNTISLLAPHRLLLLLLKFQTLIAVVTADGVLSA